MELAVRRTAAFAVAFALAACAGGSASTESNPRRNANRITSEELEQPVVTSLTLMDAIQRLRPNWLRSRGANSLSGLGNPLPALMVNESPQPLAVLQGLRPNDVQLLEFISGPDATTLYGTGYVNGLIKVKTGGVRR